MMMWISCLLIGSIACSPIQKDFDSDADPPASFMPQAYPPAFYHWGREVISDLDSSSYQPSLLNPSSGKDPEVAAQEAISSAGPGSYSSSQDVYSSSTNMAEGKAFDSGYASFRDERYNSPEVSDYGVAYAASQSSEYDGHAPGGSFSSSASAPVGDSLYGFVVAPQVENWSSGYAKSYGGSDENPEPVFSDVSDLEPVYSFSSRSSYQRGRAVFAQTHYTPREPVPPLIPVPGLISKTTSKQSSPAKVPTKGGF